MIKWLIDKRIRAKTMKKRQPKKQKMRSKVLLRVLSLICVP
jgi:hypothetical protein